jgi:hypothetical protein
MNLIAQIVVTGACLFFVGIACVMLVKPAAVEGFVLAFASSRRAHYKEMFFRLLIGASLVVLSQRMWQANLFLIFGWALIVSAVVLLVLPWQWHHRLGERVLPILVRHMRLYALGILAFGALLLYATYHAYFNKSA